MGATISQATYPPFIFSLIVGIPSLILYILEILIIFVNAQHFGSAFFRMFIARFITNFIYYFCSYCFIRLGRIGLFFDFFTTFPTILLAFFHFFHFYTIHYDNLSTLFILLNRLTLLVYPIKHAKIWKYLLPVSISLTCLVPLSCTIQTFTYHSDFFVFLQKDNRTFSVAIHVLRPGITLPSAYLAAWSSALFAVSCGILNILIVFLYRRARSAQNANSRATRLVEQQVESRLTFYAIVTFIAQLVLAIYNAFIYVSSWINPNPIANANLFLSLSNQFCWIYDVSNIVLPAWFLLWASSQIRELIFSLLLPRSWQTQTALFTERRTVTSIKLSRIAGGSSTQ